MIRQNFLCALFVLGFAALPSLHAQTSPTEKPRYSSLTDETSRFVFYSVLEGLYEDGLSSQDVDLILLKHEGESYFNFIYSCPICTPAIQALQTYRARPEHLYSLKSGDSTFGKGLSASLHDDLYSGDSRHRLAAINTLMQGWIERRIKSMNLPVDEHARLLSELEDKRKEGMEALESFRRHEHGQGFGVEKAAPAYVDLDECAVCNGAVGKPMKLPEPGSK